MTNKMNGSGNGHDKEDHPKDAFGNIIGFPDAKKREKLKAEEEARIRDEYKARQKAEKKAAHEPFFKFGNIPPFTKVLFALIFIVHAILFLLLDSGTRLQILYTFGFMPANFTMTDDFKVLSLLSPITHIFIHGGWLHLAFNLIMGLVLSLFFEKTFGARACALTFFLCALAGAALFAATAPFSTSPVIGASGGISGLFGAFLYLTLSRLSQPPAYNVYSTRRIMGGANALQDRARTLVRDKGPWPVIIFWGLLMTALGLLAGGRIAWAVHLGGYACGVYMAWLMNKGKLRL